MTSAGPGRDRQVPTRAQAAPHGRLRRLGEACLWLLVIFAAVLAALYVASRLRLIVLPVLLAAVLATFLEPPAGRLRRAGWPPALAAAVVVIAGLTLLAGVLAFLVPQFVAEAQDLDVGLTDAVDKVQKWIVDSPLPFSNSEIVQAIDQVQQQVRDSAGELAGRVFSGAMVALEVVIALLLAVVVTFFLLKDGDRIWSWLVGWAPEERRPTVRESGQRAWEALGGFIRGQTLVALFDAILIGLALVVLGVPLALPIAVLTFFGAYVPVIGAFVTGMLAVLIGFVDEGLVTALLVFGAVVIVQQLEGNFFQPVVVGRAVKVHPLAILLGVTAGGVLAGIIGAMMAAPVVAVSGALLGYVRELRAAPSGSTEAGAPDET